MPEDMPDRMPNRMSEDMSDRMPEDMPDRMPEDLPDRMSEDMSDRMPEDVPVRTCINVMVGITRSKVIYPRVSALQPWIETKSPCNSPRSLGNQKNGDAKGLRPKECAPQNTVVWCSSFILGSISWLSNAFKAFAGCHCSVNWCLRKTSGNP